FAAGALAAGGGPSPPRGAGAVVCRDALVHAPLPAPGRERGADDGGAHGLGVTSSAAPAGRGPRPLRRGAGAAPCTRGLALPMPVVPSAWATCRSSRPSGRGPKALVTRLRVGYHGNHLPPSRPPGVCHEPPATARLCPGAGPRDPRRRRGKDADPTDRQGPRPPLRYARVHDRLRDPCRLPPPDPAW